MSTYPKKRAVVFIVLFLFTLALLGATLYKIAHKPDEQNAKYLSLKEGYAKNHPNQILILYPWNPTSPVKILPFDFVVPAVPGNNLSIRGCPDQFASASFVINTQDDISDIGITASDLRDAHNASISSDEINIRLVKVWYQAGGDDIWYEKPGSVPVPELLLKDDSLVKVDHTNRFNYLKVTINGNQQYIDISNPKGTFPVYAEIHDSPLLQPFSMKKNENKQIWMTIHIPDTTPAGDYQGMITITTPSYTPVTMNFSVVVLPFTLEPAVVEYALYYRGVLSSEITGKIDSERKTRAQYVAELNDMKVHGIQYPTIYSADADNIGSELLLRKQSGLPEDHIYILGINTGNSTDDSDLTRLGDTMKQWKYITAQYGFRDMYIYGIDEASGDVLRSERSAWNTVHQNGAKVFVACYSDAVDIVGDLLDTAIVAGPLNTTQAAQWHMNGKRIFSYANPQVGVENPFLYRRNYGFALWNAGYDGTMNYAYQHGFGNIWNDFDHVHYRDHVFAYPTSEGVIDTVQWEGFREGVDDTRFIATLLKNGGDHASVRTMIADSLSKGEDPAEIREKVIDQILLSSQTPLPASLSPA